MVESDPAGGYIVTLLSTTDLPDHQSLKAHGLAWRLFGASELLLGAVIVIGHNVFHDGFARGKTRSEPRTEVLGLSELSEVSGNTDALRNATAEREMR